MSPQHPVFVTCVSHIFKWEGGYSDDPDDPGGETKYGISKRAYPQVDIKELTQERAKKIYFEDYWKRAGCDHAHEHARLLHFDTAVNMGVEKAIRLLQRSSGATEDGIWGPETKTKAGLASPEKYAMERGLEYMRIIGEDHGLAKYASGWKRRLEDTYRASTNPDNIQ